MYSPQYSTYLGTHIPFHSYPTTYVPVFRYVHSVYHVCTIRVFTFVRTNTNANPPRCTSQVLHPCVTLSGLCLRALCPIRVLDPPASLRGGYSVGLVVFRTRISSLVWFGCCRSDRVCLCRGLSVYLRVVTHLVFLRSLFMYVCVRVRVRVRVRLHRVCPLYICK